MELLKPTKQYKVSSRLVYSCQYHVIFCPKYRRKVLVDDIERRLKQLVLEKQKDYDYEIIEMECDKDHIHLLIDVNPKIGVFSVVSKIKGYSSKVLREEFPELKSKLPCLWTHSSFISTVGAVSLEVVRKYIENQKNV